MNILSPFASHRKERWIDEESENRLSWSSLRIHRTPTLAVSWSEWHSVDDSSSSLGFSRESSIVAANAFCIASLSDAEWRSNGISSLVETEGQRWNCQIELDSSGTETEEEEELLRSTQIRFLLSLSRYISSEKKHQRERNEWPWGAVSFSLCLTYS